MKAPARQAVLRMLQALSDQEFAQLAAEARGMEGDAIADLLSTAEYDLLQQDAAKREAVQRLQERLGGGNR